MRNRPTPEQSQPPEIPRSRGFALRPWGLLVSATGCSYAAALAGGSLRNTLIGLAGAQAAATFGILVDRTIHPRDWFRRDGRINGRRSYSPFPYKRYLRRLATADRIVIIDTVPHLLTGPYRQRFLDALRTALSRGARVDIAVYCPCSEQLERRAGQLDQTVLALRDQAEAALSTLDQFKATLSNADRERLVVWLHRKRLDSVYYRCDDRVLRSFLIGAESQTCHHELYSATSAEGRRCEELLADIARVPRAKTFFDSHMRGVLKVGDKRFAGIPHIIDYTRPDCITYIAVPAEALTALAACTDASWYQGSTRTVKCELELCVDDYVLRWAIPRYRQRYATDAVPALYRITSCRTKNGPVPSP